MVPQQQQKSADGEIPESKRNRSLRFSIWDASLYAAMMGFGETYFIPLLVYLGAGNFQVGIFTAAPQLGVAFAQFLSIVLVERLRLRKRIIIGGVSAQVFALAAVLSGLLAGGIDPWVFIGLAVVYFASNGVAGPAWNSLMGDLTTPENRGAYFGRRSGLSQLISFLSVLAGGVILQRFTDAGEENFGFVAIIAAAVLCRLGSVYSLTRHFEAPYRKAENSDFSFWDFVRRGPRSNFAHFVFFVGLMSFAVYMAAPFFIVYMIRDLGFSYFQYTIAQGVFIATQFVAMRRWGPFADKYGNRQVLRISSILMPLIPIMWLFSKNFYAILLFQFFSGLAWAGWALASVNFIFDAVTPPKRARCAAYLNFFNNIGIFSGSLLGAYLSARVPGIVATGVMKVIFAFPLCYLFFISAVVRFVVVLLFMPTIREVRGVSKGDAKDMFLMLTHIRALSGVRFAPFTGGGGEKESSQ